MFDEIAQESADAVMEEFSAPGVYSKPGLAGVDIDVVISRDVQVMDDAGGYTRMDTATIRSGLVTPERDDEIDIDGERWLVDSLDTDDGHLSRLFVRPESAQ